MSLYIRNAKAEKLARELAQLTGESLTSIITQALELQLQKLKGSKQAQDLVTEVTAISRRCQKLPVLDSRNAEEILGYDETGLPS